MNTDQIQKTILLKATRERVWEAISDSSKFGAWFGAQIEGPFVAGTRLQCRIAPTQVDPEVAKHQEPYAGKSFEIVVETVDPMNRLAFRWHPYEVDPKCDPTKEPMTLVAFDLSDAEGGTLLTITESGFDQIPIDRRAQAFHANEGGWTHQSKLIEKYLEQSK